MVKGWFKKFFAGFYSDEPAMLMPEVKHRHDDEDFHEQERKPLLKQPLQSGDDKPAGEDGGGDDGGVDGGDDGGGDIFVAPGS